MAKTSLNMLMRTSANDYMQDGIHMNSFDTGRVTDEDPYRHAVGKWESCDFRCSPGTYGESTKTILLQ